MLLALLLLSNHLKPKDFLFTIKNERNKEEHFLKLDQKKQPQRSSVISSLYVRSSKSSVLSEYHHLVVGGLFPLMKAENVQASWLLAVGSRCSLF